DAAAQTGVQRVIVGIEEVAQATDLAEVRAKHVGAEGREIEFLPCVGRACRKLQAAVADIRELQHGVSHDLLLQTETPVHGIGVAHALVEGVDVRWKSGCAGWERCRQGKRNGQSWGTGPSS